VGDFHCNKTFFLLVFPFQFKKRHTMTTTSSTTAQKAYDQFLQEGQIVFRVNAARHQHYSHYRSKQFDSSLRISKEMATNCLAGQIPKIQGIGDLYFMESEGGAICAISREEMIECQNLVLKTPGNEWRKRFALVINNTEGGAYTEFMPYETAPTYECDPGVSTAKKTSAYVASNPTMLAFKKLPDPVFP
jgi:hypothetical protein